MSDTIQYKPITGLNETSLNKIIEISGKELAEKSYVDAAVSNVTVDTTNLATKSELETKVNKVEGKGLSTEDFTTEYKNKLEGLNNTGVSDEQISIAVNKYLQDNPVTGGATAEQVAQIEANKTAIDELNAKLNNGEEGTLSDLVEGRVLVWHDEFEDGKIDKTKWGNIYGYGASKSCLFPMDIDKNIYFSDGKLNYFCINNNPSSTAGHSSAYLYTADKFEFRYGLIEARVKFSPETVGHSTFWTLGANVKFDCTENEVYSRENGVPFPACGEIDIAEWDNGLVGQRTHYSNGINDTTYNTGADTGKRNNNASEWHIYGAEWTDTKIIFYMDRVKTTEFDISKASSGNYNPFNLPHFLILNSVPKLTGTPTWDMMNTQVDWIRVYAPVGCEKNIETNLTFDQSSYTINVGDVINIFPTFTPEYVADMTLRWDSYNEDIITVYNGRIKGIKAGTSFIRAVSKNGLQAMCKIIVQGSQTPQTPQTPSNTLEVNTGLCLSADGTIDSSKTNRIFTDYIPLNENTRLSFSNDKYLMLPRCFSIDKQYLGYINGLEFSKEIVNRDLPEGTKYVVLTGKTDPEADIDSTNTTGNVITINSKKYSLVYNENLTL